VRKQFVLDERSYKLLEELASYGGGNRSLVIREAIQVYADMEERLDKIEADPRFQHMMDESERAVREQCVTSHEEVLGMSRARSRRRTKRRS
jgi:metal-responsive CopG/Arc/MetJ family transcriptional regulator